MTGSLATDEQIRDLLTNSRLWFVVGLGDNPGRPAYGVARFLLDLGKTVVPIHPRAETVTGTRASRRSQSRVVSMALPTSSMSSFDPIGLVSLPMTPSMSVPQPCGSS